MSQPTAKIFEVKRFAVHDGDGIRTTVFFKGCPLKCVWCHNPEGISFSEQLAVYENKCSLCRLCVSACKNKVHSIANGKHVLNRENCVFCGECQKACPSEAIKLYGKQMTVREILPVLLEDKDFYDNSAGGVTLSGGECLCQADFCEALLRELKSRGIHTAVDTCGFVPKSAIDKVMPYTDIFLYDIKAVDEDVHTKCTGHSNAAILENLKYIDGCGKKTQVRIPYVPCCNDGEMEKIADFLVSIKNLTSVKLLGYHNYAGSKYASLSMENTLPDVLPTQEQLSRVSSIFRKKGLTVAE